MTSIQRTPVFDRMDAPVVRRSKKRTRAIAIVAAMIVHVVLFVAAFSTAGGGPISGGGGVRNADDGAITVSLAGYKIPRSEQNEIQSAEQFAALFAKTRASQADFAIEASPRQSQPHSDLDQLFKELDREHSATGKQDAGRSTFDKGGQGSAADANARQASERKGGDIRNAKNGETGADASTGSLWGQIEPCWRKMPNISTVPVSLEVTIDPSGRISIPPKILRPQTAPLDERRLISEARALAALTACTPYHGAGASSGKVRIDFAASR